jgi:hypothetical protein
VAGPTGRSDPADHVDRAGSGAGPPEQGSDRTPSLAIHAGDCDVGWLPDGMLEDLPFEQSQDLVDAMRQWVGRPSIRGLRIDWSRGIMFAKSEDDLGSDPPYPNHTRAQGQLACGVVADWLADHIQEAFARAADFTEITCHDNVCCFSGMEFVSRGILVARTDASAPSHPWIIEAYVEVAEATLVPEVVAAHRKYVREALQRRPQSCPDEPSRRP